MLKVGNRIEFRVSRLVAAGVSVSLERVDYITLNDKSFAVPIVGFMTFEEAGKFSEWRDYFDTQS